MNVYGRVLGTKNNIILKHRYISKQFSKFINRLNYLKVKVNYILSANRIVLSTHDIIHVFARVDQLPLISMVDDH